MRGHPFTRNVRNAEQDNRVADFDNFCDEQISRMRDHPLQTTLLTHLDHSHFCPKRGVPQTSIVISCQFVNISKGNNTIDIAFFSLLYVLHYDRNVRNAEQDNRVADFDNFSDEQISPKRGHPFTRNVRNAEQDNRVADFDNFCDEQISRMSDHPLQTTLLTHLDHSHFCPKRGVP